jgi:hypothetical protein
MWALILSVVNGLGAELYGAVAPNIDERATVVTVGAVITVIMIGTAWWLLGGSRWAAIAVIAVNAISILMGVPPFFDGSGGSFLFGDVVSLILSALTIACVLSPDARGYWNAATKRMAGA